MGLLEMVSDEIYRGFFVDLYVCCANTVAVAMYEEFGYSVYRRVREYYGNIGIGKGGRDEEDAFGRRPSFFFPLRKLRSTSYPDMRKPLSRDPHRRSVRSNGRDMIVSAQEVAY